MGDAPGVGADPLQTAAPSEFVLPQPRSAREHVGDAEPMILGLIPEPEPEPAGEAEDQPDVGPQAEPEPVAEAEPEIMAVPEPEAEPELEPVVALDAEPAREAQVEQAEHADGAEQPAEWIEALFEEESHPAPADADPTQSAEPDPATGVTPVIETQPEVAEQQPTPAYQAQPQVAHPQPQVVQQPVAAGAWWPDYSGRFELRWHDGVVWTAYVSTRGAVYTDPFGL